MRSVNHSDVKISDVEEKVLKGDQRRLGIIR